MDALWSKKEAHYGSAMLGALGGALGECHLQGQHATCMPQPCPLKFSLVCS